MASEVCLIDHDANKASAEAEDIQHVGFFLGCPLVTGTSGTRQPRLYIYISISTILTSMLSSTNTQVSRSLEPSTIHSAWKGGNGKSVREIRNSRNVSVDAQRVGDNGPPCRKGNEGRSEFLGPAEILLRSCPLISSLIYIVSPSVSPSFSPLDS